LHKRNGNGRLGFSELLGACYRADQPAHFPFTQHSVAAGLHRAQLEFRQLHAPQLFHVMSQPRQILSQRIALRFGHRRFVPRIRRIAAAR
jgi:hypothetical protein